MKPNLSIRNYLSIYLFPSGLDAVSFIAALRTETGAKHTIKWFEIHLHGVHSACPKLWVEFTSVLTCQSYKTAICKQACSTTKLGKCGMNANYFYSPGTSYRIHIWSARRAKTVTQLSPQFKFNCSKVESKSNQMLVFNPSLQPQNQRELQGVAHQKRQICRAQKLQ